MAPPKQKENCSLHDHGRDTARYLAAMPGQSTFERAADTFQLISDSTRIKIVWLLCHSEECVTNIAIAIEMSAPAVSHHLRVLKQSGLIKSRRMGKETHYSLSDSLEAAFVRSAMNDIFNLK